MGTSITQGKIPESDFLKMRPEALNKWPTGKEVDLAEAVEYQKSLPENKVTQKVVERLHNEGGSSLFPRTGVPFLESQIKYCQTLAAIGVQVVVIPFDTFTREGQYNRVQQGLEESLKENRAKLNGYPMVNLGLKKTRQLIESCDCAFNARAGWISAPITAEMALASGFTSLGNIGAFLLFGCYHKSQRLEEFINIHKYVWRLMGYYADHGVIIPTDDHGWQPGFVFPYDVSIACTILNSLMMAEQGVKSIIPHIEGQGNIWQDIAVSRVGRKLLREYLNKYNYSDVLVPGALNGQLPLYPVPSEIAECYAYSDYSALVQALSESELMFVRTLDEGLGVPSQDALELSNKSAKWVINVVREQKIHIENKYTTLEEEMSVKSVKAIVDKVLEIGNGDPISGSIKAVEDGILDSPMSPNVNVKDQVMGIRDAQGAIRYLEFGNLPIPEEVKEFHRDKVAERARIEGRKMDYQVAVEDFWAPSRGHLIGKPLNKNMK